MKKSRSLKAILILIVLLLSASCQMAASMDESIPAAASEVNKDRIILLHAVSGSSIEFQTQNGQTIDNNPPQVKEIPHLVLHRNGVLAPLDERTLIVEMTYLKVASPGITVTLIVETQHSDPDSEDDSGYYFQVWNESVWLPISDQVEVTKATKAFTLTFDHSMLVKDKLIPTPTGYFRIEITTSEPGEMSDRRLYNEEFAFLMEDQVVTQLPQVVETSEGAAPDELVVAYCDMTPFQNRSAEETYRMARAEVPNYVQMRLVPQMIEIFRTQTDEWGFPWHEAWTSYHDGDNRERLVVTLSDGQTWYYGPAPSGGHAGISLNVAKNIGSARYDSLTDRLLSLFQHELFHNIQRNLALHYNGSGDIAGKEGKWAFFSEGTADLASSVGSHQVEFSGYSGQSSYMLNANKFIGGNGLSGNLNDSYTDMEGITTAIYWRFLYEQCGGMDVVYQSLITLYSGEIVNINQTVDMVNWIPAILDESLSQSNCPFKTHRESLDAFARALYALHLNEGRCPAMGDSRLCGLYDPNHMYASPTCNALHYRGEMMRYGAEKQLRPSGIPASYGIDFIEIDIESDAINQPIIIEVFGQEDSDATFDVQVWELKVDGKNITPANVSVLLSPNKEGHMTYFLSSLESEPIKRLAIIVTRIDANESTDPVGTYTLLVRPGSE